jgi:hypothetical protein
MRWGKEITARKEQHVPSVSLGIINGAMQHTRLNQTEYGLTQQRLYASAFTGWPVPVFVAIDPDSHSVSDMPCGFSRLWFLPLEFCPGLPPGPLPHGG